MEPVNNTTRKRNMLLFGLALFVTAGIVFFLFTSLKQMTAVNIASNNADNDSAVVSSQDNVLLGYDEQLVTKLKGLQALDEQFTDMMISAAPNKNYDSLNSIILQQEEDFRKTIESINLEGAALNNKGGNSFFSKMIASFKSILESRRSVGSLRNAVSISQTSFTPDEKALFKLQEELMTKTNRVNVLENSLSVLEKKAVNNQHSLSKQNEKFADSIQFIASINVLENKISTLNSNINNLKQDNDRLQKQQNETAKNAGSNELVLKEKANGLQQKVEALNAELQLARVDCNLNRVDATQIISTAKQRKVLLTEASSILTDLSSTGNSEVKRKAQEKIMRLNQVASNSRD